MSAGAGPLPDPQFWRGRRVLVTGHTGFKGSWLCLWLSQLGAEVHGFGLDAGDPSLFAQAAVTEVLASDVRGDVRDAAAVGDAFARARPAVLLHLAAQAIVRRSLEQPAETFAINVGGTATVLDAARREDVRATVVVTSDKCYANREWLWGYREDDPLGGKDPYSASKAAQELVAGAYRQTMGMPRLATARAGNVIGGGDWGADRLIPDAMRATASGAPLEVRNPASVRPWQHVLCPLHGYLLLCERLAGEDGPAHFGAGWNFGPAGDEARPVREIVERIAERSGGRLDVRWGTGGEGTEAGLLKLDSSRARELLEWRPRWGLWDGVEATAAWYAGQRDGRDPRRLATDQIERYCET